MLLTGICVVIFLLLSLCWKYCANEEKGTSLFESENGERVIAREVRPGLIVVQNCRTADETLRIIQEYDVMRGEMPLRQFPQYGGINPPSPAHTTCTYVQNLSPGNSPHHLMPNTDANELHNSATCETLIDIGDEVARPPPYNYAVTYATQETKFN